MCGLYYYIPAHPIMSLSGVLDLYYYMSLSVNGTLPPRYRFGKPKIDIYECRWHDSPPYGID